jgi:uncharacterized protein (DUF433 family)
MAIPMRSVYRSWWAVRAKPAACFESSIVLCLYIAGTGVSLDSVPIYFRQGASPQTIVQSFSTDELSQVYAAYYLENEETDNSYLAEGERDRGSTSFDQTTPYVYGSYGHRRDNSAGRVGDGTENGGGGAV